MDLGKANPRTGSPWAVQEDKHPSWLQSKPRAQRQQGMNSSTKTSSLPSYAPGATGKVLEVGFHGFRGGHSLRQSIRVPWEEGTGLAQSLRSRRGRSMQFVCSHGKMRPDRAGFGQGSAGPREDLHKKKQDCIGLLTEHRGRGAPGEPPITHKGRGEAECPLCPTRSERSKGHLSEGNAF